MATVDLRISRRQSLASSLAGSALMGTRVPGFAAKCPEPAWFARGEVATTYNYCDMCPWKCGGIVQSVDGKVIKIDGNPADPKSRGMLCPRGHVVTYCGSGHRSAMAIAALHVLGADNVKGYGGSFTSLVDAGLPIATP